MIRKYNANDTDSVLEIWLNVSVKAHDFISADFWESQVENMRNIYIPASETYVYEVDSKVVGFYALYENSLAAIFVSPELQGKGIGKQLLSHAKAQRVVLSLSVYKKIRLVTSSICLKVSKWLVNKWMSILDIQNTQ